MKLISVFCWERFDLRNGVFNVSDKFGIDIYIFMLDTHRRKYTLVD